MKIQRLLSGISMGAAMLSLTATTAFAQDASQQKKVQIQIEENENGNVIHIDTSFTITDDVDVDALLRSLGLEGGMGDLSDDEQMEIVIKKMGEGGDFHDMTIELEGLENLEEELQKLQEELGDHPMVLEKLQNQLAMDPNRPFLGIYYESLDPTKAFESNLPQSAYYGAKIESVIEGTGAASAGLKEGDIIIGIDGSPLTKEATIHTLMSDHKAGDVIGLTLLREGSEIEVEATLGEPQNIRELEWIDDDGSYKFNWDEEDFDKNDFKFHFEGLEDMAQKPFLGVYLDGTENAGLRISGTVEGGTAAGMGLEEGDVLMKINDTPVSNLEELGSALGELEIGEQVEVTYQRDGVTESSSGAIQSKASANTKEFDLKKGLNQCTGSLEDKIHWEMMEHGESMPEGLLEDLEQLRDLDNINVFFKDEEMEGEGPHMIKTVAIFITMDDVSNEDANRLNENIDDHKITTENTLPVESVFFGPNPGEGLFNLRFDLIDNEPADLRVYDMNGQVVYQEALEGKSGSYERQIDITGSPKGTYFLHINQGEKNYNKKVVIQ